MMRPVTVDSATVTASTRRRGQAGRRGPGPPSSSADRQLVSTIIDPTDRSMPPEITITAWAMARKARLIVPAVMVRISKAPNCGSCETRQSSSTTSSSATPTVQP